MPPRRGGGQARAEARDGNAARDPLGDSMKPEIRNKRGVGLVSYDRGGQIVQLSNIGVRCWARIKEMDMDMLGYVFAIKFHTTSTYTFVYVPMKEVREALRKKQQFFCELFP